MVNMETIIKKVIYINICVKHKFIQKQEMLRLGHQKKTI